MPERRLFTQDPLEDATHWTCFVIRTAELSQIQKIIQPRVIKDLGPIIHIEFADFFETQSTCDTECQQSSGGGPGDEVDIVEESLQTGRRLEALHQNGCDDPTDAPTID